MEIKELTIEGYKSIRNITISNPNPFSVFVGPNAAGKSNIFEALEFFQLCNTTVPFEIPKLFGGIYDITNKSSQLQELVFKVNLEKIKPELHLFLNTPIIDNSPTRFSFRDFGIFNLLERNKQHFHPGEYEFASDENFIQFTNFTRIFVGNDSLVKRKIQDDSRLSLDASNLELVLKRIFKNEPLKEEILEILQLLIPGFANIEIATEELSRTDNLLIYENALQKPLTKKLISDGTFNIIALIAAIYQSDEPQFLCIEEPENGLNPKVVSQLVQLFRDKCKEKGHFIWLNTHSQTLVSQLRPEEIILVDKVNGETQIKQIPGMNLHGMRMDEALLTNALGGGIPW